MKLKSPAINLLLRAAIFFSCILPGHSTAAGDAEPRLLSISFGCLRHAVGHTSLIVKNAADAEPAEIRIYQGGFSEPVRVLAEDGRVALYRRGGNPGPAWLQDWSFPVPGNADSVHVLLLPPVKKTTATANAPYSAYLLPAESEFPFGSVHALNLTTRNARFEFGSKSLVLAPGASGTSALQSEADTYNTVPFAVWLATSGGALKFHATRWLYSPRIRQISVLWADPALGRPEVTTLSIIKPPSLAAPGG